MISTKRLKDLKRLCNSDSLPLRIDRIVGVLTSWCLDPVKDAIVVRNIFKHLGIFTRVEPNNDLGHYYVDTEKLNYLIAIRDWERR